MRSYFVISVGYRPHITIPPRPHLEALANENTREKRVSRPAIPKQHRNGGRAKQKQKPPSGTHSSEIFFSPSPMTKAL